MSNLSDQQPIDVVELEAKVMAMYQSVAENPRGSFHFELGRGLAEHLGYPPSVLDQIPAGAIESFAGVGYFFDLADLHQGETVADLGSGSGMDVFVAAVTVGPTGHVTGVDMTPAQLAKAESLRTAGGFAHVTFVDGHIDDLPLPDDSVDAVISNGVINLAADKGRVFSEAARVLRPGGRLVIADIVTDVALPSRGGGEHRSLGLVHRWGRRDERLPAGDRERRAAGRSDEAERLPVPVRPSPRRERALRGAEHLLARPQGWPIGATPPAL